MRAKFFEKALDYWSIFAGSVLLIYSVVSGGLLYWLVSAGEVPITRADLGIQFTIGMIGAFGFYLIQSVIDKVFGSPSNKELQSEIQELKASIELLHSTIAKQSDIPPRKQARKASVKKSS